MSSIFLALVSVLFYVFHICLACSNVEELAGVISGSYSNTENEYKDCWNIEVPQDTYVRLQMDRINYNVLSCSDISITVDVAVTNENYAFCSGINHWNTLMALNNVTITYIHGGSGYLRSSSFSIKYFKESLICARNNHFRCSDHQCIHEDKVCDRVDDCENGQDEVECDRRLAAVEGVNRIRENVISWIYKQRDATYGWGKDTHRAITALYLANAAYFNGDDLEEELMAKQLELQILEALLWNATDPITVSELSMFMNALTVTSRDPRQFYGFDLVQILYERVSATKTPYPGAYLTLCNSKWIFSESDVSGLLKILQMNSDYPFLLDIQAVTVMALTCLKNKSEDHEKLINDSNIYDATIKKFIDGQLSDGSFGNVYTTGLITQAVISSGQEVNKQWNVTSTAKYLMQQLNSTSLDFLSTYLVLPTFSSRSLLDVDRRDEKILIHNVIDNLRGEKRIQYTLYIGDDKEVIHTIHLKMSVSSSAYDVMRVAQVTDPKYKFLHIFTPNGIYVYEIAGITNDPEAGKFWMLYTMDNRERTIISNSESPNKIILKDASHLVMWYKTVHI